MNILLVEDDLDLGNGVRIALQDQGMAVVWVRRAGHWVMVTSHSSRITPPQ